MSKQLAGCPGCTLTCPKWTHRYRRRITEEKKQGEKNPKMTLLSINPFIAAAVQAEDIRQEPEQNGLNGRASHHHAECRL